MDAVGTDLYLRAKGWGTWERWGSGSVVSRDQTSPEIHTRSRDNTLHYTTAVVFCCSLAIRRQPVPNL